MSASITEYGEAVIGDLTEIGESVNGIVTELGKFILNSVVPLEPIDLYLLIGTLVVNLKTGKVGFVL